MKKLILPILLILTIELFLPSKADAQTKQECNKTRARASYDCLTGWTKCYYPCTDRTKDVSACYKSCKQSEDACNKQVDADYKACLAAKQKTPEPKASVVSEAEKQPPSLEKEKQEDPKQDGVPVFISEWFSRFSQAIGGLIALPGAFTDVVYEDKFYLDGDFPNLSEMSLENFYQGNWYPNDDTPDRSPNITVEDEQKAWDFDPLDTSLTEKVNITLLQGEAQIKNPDSPQFIPIGPKGGDTQQVTFFDSTVKPTSDSVQLRHTWSSDSGAVINAPKWSEIKFREPVEVGGVTSHTVELGQGEVEVKVRNNKPAENQFGVDAGWLGVTVSRTHFWVSQSQDKKLAVVGVYEGEVEVKTKDGQTIKVKPNGDKAGVVVVSKKLSPFKLGIFGLVIAGVIGGVIWVVKRKFLPKTSKKR